MNISKTTLEVKPQEVKPQEEVKEKLLYIVAGVVVIIAAILFVFWPQDAITENVLTDKQVRDQKVVIKQQERTQVIIEIAKAKEELEAAEVKYYNATKRRNSIDNEINELLNQFVENKSPREVKAPRNAIEAQIQSFQAGTQTPNPKGLK